MNENALNDVAQGEWVSPGRQGAARSGSALGRFDRGANDTCANNNRQAPRASGSIRRRPSRRAGAAE
ncbi:MAG: hypothetical protein ACOCZE_10310, partial [Planctomycetota bacterium]